MAGEYSRELSTKVFAGQCRLIELGFRQGGPPGYALRRQLLDHRGQPKSVLARGEHKSLQTDRVILVPGPEEEVKTVRWIYRQFVDKGQGEQQIADALNEQKIPRELGLPWTRGTVHQVLTNEKYIGNNVWNRVSYKLKKNRMVNAPDMWVRRDGAYEALVDPKLFLAAREIIQARARRYSDEEMLDLLRRCLQRHGALSGLIINETEGMPSSTCYLTRFGSLVRAYELVGYSPGRDYRYIEINRRLRQLHPEIIESIKTGLESRGGWVRQDSDTDMLIVNDEVSVSVVVSRAMPTGGGGLRWKIRFDTGLRPDISVVVRMNGTNSAPLDYFLFPRLDIEAGEYRLKHDNAIHFDAYRFESLEYFYSLGARAQIREAA